ncbi:MAG: class I SAM-dependent methyltransferase [Flavobacteriaceae bacterium]|nr:class I SAM-dependent methyltransferase [Flavobacteriaceae bacterium]
MEKKVNYIEINKKLWNAKTEVHYDSEFYDNDNFIKGVSSLNPIELALLGDIKGKSILHLQCHFGQDTISLSRNGAQATGIDLSNKAIEKANQLAKITKQDIEFICCDIYDLPQHLNKKFDLVFSSYGTIGWLPDLTKWASIISHFLKPGGEFIFAEFHPVVWMFDDHFSRIQYNYFNSGAIIEQAEGTYAEKEANIKNDFVVWNHSLSDVINNLLQQGLTLDTFNEYDYSPYDCFEKTIKIADRQYRIEHLNNKIPMVYALKATKK